MAEASLSFTPIRRRGIFLHSGAALLNLALVAFLSIQALAQQVRGFFILYLIAAVVAFIPLPLVLYRLFALVRSKYQVDRDGFYLQWGLRAEDIPMIEVDWVRLLSDLPYKLELPRLSVAGCVVGITNHPDLGSIEFIATHPSELILIATHSRIFAISPKDIRGFMNAYQRSAELGSIAPIASKSSRADFLASSLLSDRTARWLILSSTFLSAALLIIVSFIIPTRDVVPLDYDPINQTLQATPAERLLLFPVLSLLMLVADLAVGSYLYRKEGFRMASYLTFASALILPVSFFVLLALLMI